MKRTTQNGPDFDTIHTDINTSAISY
jgi:hypothetical protein